MNFTSDPFKRLHWHNFGLLVLSITFLAGFLSGTAVTFPNQALYASLMRRAAIRPVSLLCLLAHVAVLFLLTALIHKTRKITLYLFLIYAQAFSYGIVSSSACYAFGTAHWMLRPLLHFTGGINLISLLWFWCRQALGQSHSARNDFRLSLIISVISALFDHYLISPFLLKLFI